MALQKDFELPSGVIGNYFRIVSIEIDKNINDSKVVLGLYKDLEARQAGKVPMQTIVYHIEGQECSDLCVGNNLLALVYSWLKNRPEFEGSIDV